MAGVEGEGQRFLDIENARLRRNAVLTAPWGELPHNAVDLFRLLGINYSPLTPETQYPWEIAIADSHGNFHRIDNTHGIAIMNAQGEVEQVDALTAVSLRISEIDDKPIGRQIIYGAQLQKTSDKLPFASFVYLEQNGGGGIALPMAVIDGEIYIGVTERERENMNYYPNLEPPGGYAVGTESAREAARRNMGARGAVAAEFFNTVREIEIPGVGVDANRAYAWADPAVGEGVNYLGLNVPERMLICLNPSEEDPEKRVFALDPKYKGEITDNATRAVIGKEGLQFIHIDDLIRRGPDGLVLSGLARLKAAVETPLRRGQLADAAAQHEADQEEVASLRAENERLKEAKKISEEDINLPILKAIVLGGGYLAALVAIGLQVAEMTHYNIMLPTSLADLFTVTYVAVADIYGLAAMYFIKGDESFLGKTKRFISRGLRKILG